MKRGKWIRVSLLLVLALTLALPAAAQVRNPILNDSEEPGSVLVFHKFIRGTVPVDSTSAPKTEIEISATCPKGVICAERAVVKLMAHWVCPGSQQFEDKFVCKQTNFNLFTTVNGTIALNANGTVSPPQATSLGTGRIPTPPCEKGYLIVWVVDVADRPVKFDGLIGNAVIREFSTSAGAYNALPIQANPLLANFALTEIIPNGALDFNGVEYQAVTGKIFGTVRYDKLTSTPPLAATFLTLLTLNVKSNLPNNPTFVGFNFYNEREEVLSTSWEFVCWTQVMLSDIDANLTEAGMGSRKGLVESGLALKQPFVAGDTFGPATLLGIIETKEMQADQVIREYSYSTYNDSTPVLTTFFPTFIP